MLTVILSVSSCKTFCYVHPLMACCKEIFGAYFACNNAARVIIALQNKAASKFESAEGYFYDRD